MLSLPPPTADPAPRSFSPGVVTPTLCPIFRVLPLVCYTPIKGQRSLLEGGNEHLDPQRTPLRTDGLLPPVVKTFHSRKKSCCFDHPVLSWTGLSPGFNRHHGNEPFFALQAIRMHAFPPFTPGPLFSLFARKFTDGSDYSPSFPSCTVGRRQKDR